MGLTRHNNVTDVRITSAERGGGGVGGGGGPCGLMTNSSRVKVCCLDNTGVGVVERKRRKRRRRMGVSVSES